MNFDKFLIAQDEYYFRALDEVKNGRKSSHWMWFVFPQIKGLGKSEIAKKFEINSKEEAIEYYKHPITGPRLLEISYELLEVKNRSIHDILGYPDDLKLKSSMTLFALTQPTNKLFAQVLDKYFDGERCKKTINTLNI